jgi:hypothetical protein
MAMDDGRSLQSNSGPNRNGNFEKTFEIFKK